MTKIPARLGDPLSRVEGREKVTGTARYAAEYDLPGCTYGVLVTSSVTRGRIKNLDTRKAERAPGVLAVLTHLNAPKVPGYQTEVNNAESRVYGQEFRVFYDARIYYSNQPVALAIADTLERATYAASLVQVTYETQPHHTDLAKRQSQAFKPERSEDYAKGDAQAYTQAPVRLEQTYRTPIQVHNTMEPHAATAVWQGDTLTVYNKTQAVKIAQKDLMKAFQLQEEQVRIHSPFVGGAFGSSSRVWPQEMAAVLGAKKVNRPVKVALRREQVFNMVGYRPNSIQRVSLGAERDGTLVGIRHEAYGMTSSYEQFTERIIDPTKSMYACPHVHTRYQLVSLDVSTPCWTRGPGETSGAFALESAMDELAYALNLDPLALRLKNYGDKDPENDKPWSSKYLRECYDQGAQRFGWHRRNPKPRSMRTGEWLIGLGMASGIYGAKRDTASAKARLRADGTLVIQSATADVGPGTYTIMSQIASDVMGMDVEQIHFELGNSSFPPAPGQFGSQTTASVGSAVYDVCLALKQRLRELAVLHTVSPLYGLAADDLVFEQTQLKAPKGSKRISFTELLKLNQLQELEVTKESKAGPEGKSFSSKSFCANFVEVHVHPQTGQVRIHQIVSAVDAGKIINHKTARSQVYGSVVWGIGMALMEEGVIDHRYGKYVNNNLADYHLPTHADVPNIDVILIDKSDPILDPMGAKGMGEIGLVGFTAAVANAIYHATGQRIRDLPITPDKVLG